MKLLNCASCLLIIATTSLHGGEWKSLFNGENLDGWELVNGKAPYSVIDGSIVGVTVMDSANSFLATKETYGDFILELDFKQEGESNSGVQFRSLSNKDYMNYRVHGYQFEIDPSPRKWTGGIYDEARRKWLYPVTYNPNAKDLYQYGEWNSLRIEAIGNSLRTFLNGMPVAHLIDDVTAEGFFALQVHAIGNPNSAGKRTYWKNIRIQTEDLNPSPVDMNQFIRNMIPNYLSEAEKQQGWRLLWDGETTEGWRESGRESFPEKGWSMKDGSLIVKNADSKADILTIDTFSAFEFQADFWLSKGANSGIFYYFTEADPASGARSTGYEYQLIDDEHHPDAKKGAAGNRTLASLYDLYPSHKKVINRVVPRPVEEWAHARIIVHPDNKVEHWLEGYPVLEFDHGSPKLSAAIARSKFEKWEGFGNWSSGHILLQDHGDQVKFKSVKIRELK